MCNQVKTGTKHGRPQTQSKKNRSLKKRCSHGYQWDVWNRETIYFKEKHVFVFIFLKKKIKAPTLRSVFVTCCWSW